MKQVGGQKTVERKSGRYLFLEYLDTFLITFHSLNPFN